MSEELELALFQIITAAGGSKSNYVAAMQEAKAGNFEAAEKLIAEGDEFQNQAHDPHSKLLTLEAQGEGGIVCLLLIHAEDQMMSCEVFKQMALEVIDLYKKIA